MAAAVRPAISFWYCGIRLKTYLDTGFASAGTEASGNRYGILAALSAGPMAPAAVEPHPPTTAETWSFTNWRTLATAVAALPASSRVVRSILWPSTPPLSLMYLIHAVMPWLGGAHVAARAPVRLVDWPSLISALLA